MEKTLDYGSFGVDDRPDRLSDIPDEVLAAIDEEERRNPPTTWKVSVGEQHRLGNRERREAAIGIEQTPISFGQKIPLRRFYLVTLRHNESLSRRLQIAETQPPDFREVFTSALRPIRAAYRATRKPGVFRDRLRMRGEHAIGVAALGAGSTKAADLGIHGLPFEQRSP